MAEVFTDLLKNLACSGGMKVDLTVCGDILDVALSGGRMMTERLDEPVHSGVCAELYAAGGNAEAEEILLTEFCRD